MSLERNLPKCNKEQLIFIVKQLNEALTYVSETCVDESKSYINSRQAIEKIREHLQLVHSIICASNKNFVEEIKWQMGEISIEELHNIMGL